MISTFFPSEPILNITRVITPSIFSEYVTIQTIAHCDARLDAMNEEYVTKLINCIRGYGVVHIFRNNHMTTFQYNLGKKRLLLVFNRNKVLITFTTETKDAKKIDETETTQLMDLFEICSKLDLIIEHKNKQEQ